MDVIAEFQDDYRFLSNFWFLPLGYTIKLDGFLGLTDDLQYTTVEHAYQAAKSLDMNDRVAITRISNPGTAKRYARTIQVRSDWESVKLPLMIDLVRQKFQVPSLQQKLLNTGDAILIEGNHWHDNYWGICECKACKQKYYGENEAKNWLGRILMKIRDQLKG